jgi:uncharacterized peroxidase-related enzyme
MPLIPPAKDDDLTAFAPTFELVAAHMGFVPNSLKTMARKPGIANAFLGLSFAIMGPDSTLSAELKSLIGFAASAAHGCRYCQAHTAHSAHHAGVEADKIAALWAYETSPLFSAQERAAMRFAQCAAQTPSMVGAAEQAALKAHFTEDEIVEITAVIALFGFLNRWNDTMETTLEEGPATFANAALAKGGWQAGKHE